MMSTSLRSVFVRAPKGHLGLEIAPAKENTSGYVWVKSVDPSGPLVGKVFDGDLIARVCIDETYGLDIHAVSDLFLKSTDSHDRFLILLRPVTSQKENTAASRLSSGPKMATGDTSADSIVSKPPPTITPVVAVPSKPPPLANHQPLPTNYSTAQAAAAPHTPMAKSVGKRPFVPSSGALGPRTKKQANVVTATEPKKKIKKFIAQHTWEMLQDVPEPGFVCSQAKFYSTKNNETLTQVADKLGTDWKAIAKLKENTSRYGELKGNSVFKPGTLLFIPKQRSKWRMKQLSQVVEVESEECVDCGIESNPAEMLMCDGCDACHHVKCVGLTSVPEGDWFCNKCMDILNARAKHRGKEAVHTLDPLPALKLDPEHDFSVLTTKLRIHLQNRRAQAFSNLQNYNMATRKSFQTRQVELQNQIAHIETEIKRATQEYMRVLRIAMEENGLNGWRLGNYNKANNWISSKENGVFVRLVEKEEIIQPAQSYWDSPTMSAAWKRARAKQDRVYRDSNVKRHDKKKKNLEQLLTTTKNAPQGSQLEAKGLTATENAEHHRLVCEYASLLNEPQLKDESNAVYKHREFQPLYLGLVHLFDQTDVLAMNMLLEPDEIIIIVPVGNEKDFEPRIDQVYGVFARMALFDKKRDDGLPMEKNGVRDAQRRLFALLSSHASNKAMVVTPPSIPPTVKLRSDDENSTRCFDLSELVRDCNVDLDLPKEPTPTSMAENGLNLRDYQQSSLRWMLDKEKEATCLGLSGELWHRLRFQDPRAPVHYFFCELTGSFALDIFDYRTDVEQKDASTNRFALPTGGVLGEELGLGKTVISIALIIQNPPPLERRVLPREHIWSLEKKTVVNHPAYRPPPNVGQTNRVSNGTLIVVPMTLLSQWQTEIERFAPQLSIMTLHTAENPKIQEIASSDVVIASTFLLQNAGTKGKKGGPNLLNLIKRIHWHRLIVDEAHYNQQGEKTKQALASLSATHRASVTGTPIGAQLSDLQGQLRFLRLAPFDRPAFWKNNIEDPYYERNPESLRVLRSLLSRIVIRHSKEQTFGNGKALLSLPPRSVETVLLKFGSDTEKEVYEAIEKRNQTYFMKLKRESLKTVSSRCLVLNGLLTSARQACAHPSLVSLEKLHNFNQMTLDKDVKKKDVVVNKTRQGLLESALTHARNSAKLRMHVVVNRFQSASELLECPVCLECAGEEEIAIPACAHPLCSHCMISILDGASSTRDASGHCPTCRDIMRRSEITFLGDAADAGTKSKKDDAMDVEEDSKSAAVASVNGFQVTATSVHVSVTGASTLRAGHTAMMDKELRKALSDDRAYLSTLKEDFLRSYYDCEAKVGTKISELLAEIDAMTRRDVKSKCVVFSQFLGVLDVGAEEMQARGIGFVRLDGSCKQHERADALLDFSSNPTIKVFLLSMRSGAVGLTLTAANHCFIMDIAQNSAIEEQAIDRIHRIGQTRPVTVKRFVMQDTVEERLLGVRRSLNADRPSVGTQICGASVLANEDKVARKAAAARRNGATEELDDVKRQMRVETLEKLFGCEGGIHKA